MEVSSFCSGDLDCHNGSSAVSKVPFGTRICACLLKCYGIVACCFTLLSCLIQMQPAVLACKPIQTACPNKQINASRSVCCAATSSLPALHLVTSQPQCSSQQLAAWFLVQAASPQPQQASALPAPWSHADLQQLPMVFSQCASISCALPAVLIRSWAFSS